MLVEMVEMVTAVTVKSNGQDVGDIEWLNWSGVLAVEWDGGCDYGDRRL